jgi:hypothetical protein
MPNPAISQYPSTDPSIASVNEHPWWDCHFTQATAASMPEAVDLYPAFSTVDWTALFAGHSPLPSQTWEQPWTEIEKLNIEPASSTSPPPASAVPPTLLPGSVMNQNAQDKQLGIKLSLARKHTYFDAYWTHFHPIFPIIHRPTLIKIMPKTQGGVLFAAIMAIGAHYSPEPLAQADSRILHERCEEYLSKVSRS